MNEYVQESVKDGWILYEHGHNPRKPEKACTFAFDTETFTYIDGVKVNSAELVARCLEMGTEEKRQRITISVWCWQCYDEVNGFFMTSSFDIWLQYQALCGYKYGWCYNAKFDFSQIDYQILTTPKWKPHIKKTGTYYDKGQAWAYESIHNDMGARYAYKLWIEYRHVNRHKHVHPVEYRDFMNIFAGGLASMLESLKVTDNDGNPIRKLEMNYQDVDPANLKPEQIEYCAVDVKGLYFGIKQYNQTIEEQSNGERHIFGDNTNVMTAGGFAKAELLRSLYPVLKPSKRLKQYQTEHPLTAKQDKWLRRHHLYRGGISVVNPRFQGKLLTADQFGQPMRRYDVNSEYPFAMDEIQDLVGKPFVKSYAEWLKMPQNERKQYECILMLTSVSGSLRKGYVPVWYDPFMRDYVKHVNETGLHLMFEREFDELSQWYDLDYACENVLLYKRGERVYSPFVQENYALKAKAKKEGNKALSCVVKLKLNSAYGKLAERVDRIIGSYQINPETGAVHFVQTGKECDESGIMNVAVGSLVTAVARVWILSHIREICGEDNIINYFVYIDTDSIHAFALYDKADPYKLGGFKLEAECPAVKYLAPKTYFDIEGLKDGYITLDKNGKPEIEIHSKGINITAVKNAFKLATSEKGLSLDYVNNRFHYGQQFPVLCAMNVKGGKALLPTLKNLARDEQDPQHILTINTGYSGQYLSEI